MAHVMIGLPQVLVGDGLQHCLLQDAWEEHVATNWEPALRLAFGDGWRTRFGSEVHAMLQLTMQQAYLNNASFFGSFQAQAEGQAVADGGCGSLASNGDGKAQTGPQADCAASHQGDEEAPAGSSTGDSSGSAASAQSPELAAALARLRAAEAAAAAAAGSEDGPAQLANSSAHAALQVRWSERPVGDSAV